MSDHPDEPSRSPDDTYAVTLAWRDGRRASMAVPEGVDLVSAAERAGIALPYGCRTGVCGTCTGRLLEGSLAHDRPPRALKERYLVEGYVLTCVATPTSDVTVEVGSAVHEDLLVNPWRSANPRTRD